MVSLMNMCDIPGGAVGPSGAAHPRTVWGVAQVFVVLLCAVGVMAFGVVAAAADTTHLFLPEPSEKLGEGVPVGCGVSCVPGRLGHVLSVDVVGGHVWVGDEAEGSSQGRIDEFDDSSPWSFVGPQIDPVGGVSGIGSDIAVGDVGSEEQVYTEAQHEGQSGIGVFGSATGKLLGFWSGANTPNKSFTQLAGKTVAVVSGVAVDRSSNLVSEGDVYVSTRINPEFDVVDVFAKEPLSPSVVGEEPALVGTLTGTCATPETTCPGQEVPFGEVRGVAVSSFNGDVLVTDQRPSSGLEVVDVFRPMGAGAYEFVRQLAGPPHSGFDGEIRSVSADPENGDIYVSGSYVSGSYAGSALEEVGAVYQFSVEGVFLGRVLETTSGSELRRTNGVGVAAGSHDLFVGEYAGEAAPVGHRGALDVYGKDVFLPNVETSTAGVSVDGEGHIAVVLHGMVDPLEAGVAKCWFVRGESEEFGEADAKCEPETVADKNESVDVEATLTGLAPDRTYYDRLQASNGNGVNRGEASQDQSFHTPGPGIHSEYVADVAGTSVSFGAGIDPDKAATTFYFQYSATGPTSDCAAVPVAGAEEACSALPGPPGEALPAGGGSDETAQAHAQNLMPGTVYHYRVVAVSDLEVKSGMFAPVAFPGADRTFTTQPAGSSATVLPDGRAWELVTPPDKHGATVYEPGGAAPLRASATGDGFTLPLARPIEHGAAGFAEAAQALSVRGSNGGWSTRDISLPHAVAAGDIFGTGLEYRAFSPDLSLGVVEPQGPFTSLEPEVFPAATERTPYVRSDATCVSEPGTCYTPIATAAEGYADVTSGKKFGGLEETAHTILEPTGAVGFRGASPDLKHVIVQSYVQLTGVKTPIEAPGPGKVPVEELYEWSAEKPPAERLQLVSINEENKPSPEYAALGNEGQIGDADGRGAVSADGSRVFWTEDGVGGGGLFVRDTSLGVSLRLDKVQGGSGEGAVMPVFQGASEDGSRVFFTDEQRLTANSGAEGSKSDLYSCELVQEGSSLRCLLSDLTPESNGEAANVLGSVTGFSQDGSWVYFVADSVLGGSASEGATPGRCENNNSDPAGSTCNLYVEHFGGGGWEPPRLVAVLSGDDIPDWGQGHAEMQHLTAGVSRSGEWLAFMSDHSLTGYDNLDAHNGKPDEEAFLYRASVGGPGSLVCASCDPTGARPEGVEYAQVSQNLVGDGSSVWQGGQWLAAELPGYEQYESTRGLYQPRFLSNEGRLFFDSSDALVPQDVNGNQSVYEYEPAGVGGSAGCVSSLSTFSQSARGCIALISSGTSAGESAFVDASENGDDVFFLTTAQLTGQDIDNALDLYDAHVCTGESPCRVEQSTAPVCVTADACRAAPSQEPEVFGAPGSTALSGAGNVSGSTSTTTTTKTTKTSLTRKQKLAKALKACRKTRAKRGRAVCERQAQARFGAGKASKGKGKSSKRGGGR
ncbi:MAG TPA: hypothetical protein VGP18_11185 [Solirubrobacteraceae bacterium]|nr:hypothetical protein [Solirubrobacteraceae bacterium]